MTTRTTTIDEQGSAEATALRAAKRNERDERDAIRFVHEQALETAAAACPMGVPR